MSSDRRSLRVFISSPDDVVDEREATRRVVRRLADEFRHELDLDEVMWEWQPLLAGEHFQAQITPPHDTDVTVVVLWSRLGTPLPFQRFPGPLSKGTVTGTEWEFEDALASMRARQTPEVLVYRKRGAPLNVADSAEALDDQARQLRLVESFFRRWFSSRPDGNVDCAVRSFRSTAEFERLVEEHLRKLVNQRLTGAVSEVRWHAGSPYRGLQSFEPEHAAIFFGRDAANQALRERLDRRFEARVPFVVVLGASGSGKSSLVKAGLIPSLARGSWVGRIGVARTAVLTPASGDTDPLAALARALLSPTALPELGARGFGDAAKLAALLRESPASAANLIAQTLRDVAAAHPPGADQRAGLLIVVDQLEELFTSPFTDDARRAFVEVLEALARASAAEGLPDGAPPILVVATMRSDFYGQLDRLPSLAKLVEGDGQLLLLAPSEAEIGQMIRGPAQLAGLRFERGEARNLGLDDEILAAAQRDTRVLPLLSFVLEQLWQRRAGGSLTFDAYRALGGLEGALARRADEVVAALPPEVQAALPNLLGALVHATSARSDESSSGEAATFTARWLTLDRFSARTPERRLIDALLDPNVRLLVAEGDRDRARVRVAHEALLTHWQRAREILEADRSDLVLIDRIEEAERLWRDSPERARADRLLPSGLALAEASDLLARRRERLARPIVEFIEASQHAEHERVRRRARRARQLVSVFATLALVASVLGVFAWRKSVEAREQGLVATQRADDVLALSAQKDLEDLVARADKLWPAHPEMVPKYEEWLRDARALLEGRPADPERGIKARPSLAQHKAKLAELRARAVAQTDSARLDEAKSHPRFAELETKRAELAWRARMLGLRPWPTEADVEAALAAESLPVDADGLNGLAWPLVDPAKPRHGEEVKALLLARRAVAAASDEERAAIRDTLAWALLRLGRFDEALAEEQRAVAESKDRALDESSAQLERAVAAWRGEALAERRSEYNILASDVEGLAVIVGERAFGDPDAAWWHVQLSELVADLEALVDPEQGLMGYTLAEPFGWGVTKRYEFAKSIAERSVSGAEAKKLWDDAIEAIATSEKYRGVEWPSGDRLTPQMGLLPIGEDPDSGLWEFAHLQTGDAAVRGADRKLVLTESMGLVFVLIPGGKSWMGAQKDDPNGQNFDPAAESDESVHEVELSPYFLSKYEMTQGQWERIAASNPSFYGPDYYSASWNRAGKGWSALHPVEHVSWTDCMRLLEGLGLSLPSEAQWENGCGSGRSSVYWSGDRKEDLAGVANLSDQYGKDHGNQAFTSWEPWLDDGNTAHAEVGSYRANDYGLHDVHGNLWEWCLDGYDSGYYRRPAGKDPLAPSSGSAARVDRGGSFAGAASSARSAGRGNASPEARNDDLGLRPARGITP
jgi:formylglycine-generating enzyme required for sulfatase activity